MNARSHHGIMYADYLHVDGHQQLVLCKTINFSGSTNLHQAFDSAITRQYRFDMQLLLGTTNLYAHVIKFNNQLASMSLTKAQKDIAVETYYNDLEAVRDQDAMFMNYLEDMQFASACGSLVQNHPSKELESNKMLVIFYQKEALMSVRGSAREEYIASMKMSRV